MSRAVLLLACSTTLMGCILRDFEYEEPANVPPSVESIPTGATPLNLVVPVVLNDAPDGGVANEVLFEAEVRDPNITETLEGRVYLDDALVLELRPIPTELESDDPVRRRVSFRIPRLSLSPRCHLVELLVTSEAGFQNFPSREPREPGDIGSAAWWMAVRNDPADPVDMLQCAGAGAE